MSETQNSKMVESQLFHLPGYFKTALSKMRIDLGSKSEFLIGLLDFTDKILLFVGKHSSTLDSLASIIAYDVIEGFTSSVQDVCLIINFSQ